MIRARHASLVALVLAASFAAGLARGDEPADQGPKKVTLLYTTDIHAHYMVQKDDKAGLHGGLAALDAKVREIRSGAKNPVFLFDSGDVLTGHPISDLEQQGVVGGALFRMMNAIGYDAWCIGNHDFDHGRANVSKAVELLKFPTLSANLKIEGDPPIKIERWKILEKGGVKVGVFGLITESLDKVTGRDKIAGITATDAAAAAREAVAALQSKCDVIVALSHRGSDEDVKLADEVGGIDVILSGHNHRSLKPKFHGHRTLVAEGQKWAGKLGRLDLTLDKGHVAHFDSELLTLEPKDATGELKTILDEVQETIGKKLDEVLAKLEVPWKTDYNFESNVGDFFAEGMKARFQTDLAFLNSGGIRSNLATGDVKLGDVDEIFPFDNEIVTFELTGADLMKALEQNATASAGRLYGILQIAGVRYEYKRDGKSANVVKATVGGEPVDPKKTYKVAAIDFLAVDQHDKYFGKDVTVSKLEKTGILMTKVAEDYVRERGKAGPIKFETDGRQKEAK